jgi:hypothetical protein
MRRALIVLGLAVVAPAGTWAQEGSAGSGAAEPDGRPIQSRADLRLHRPEMLGAWGGVALNSPAGRFLGITPDRHLVMAGLRAGWRVLMRDSVEVHYTVDLIPLVIVSNNPRYEVVDCCAGRVLGSVKRTLDRGPVYGAGVSPIGFRWDVAPRRTVHPFLNGSAGILLFTREVPVPEARRFNYAFEGGMGISVSSGPRSEILFGYRLHHLSNGNTAEANPGLDAHFFYMGFTYQRR